MGLGGSQAALRIGGIEYGGSGPYLRVNFTYTARNEMESAVRSDTEVGPSQIVRTSYTYDALGRMTNLHHRDDSGASISNFTYTYDAGSRVTTEVTNGTTKTYTYDNTDQLTADGTVTVTYDANGNRNNGSYTTGTGNQITGDGTWTYSYDAEGNMTKKSQGVSAETWTYGYDQRNQLVWAEKRGTDGGTLQMRADYKYDWNGNRIQKAVDTDGDTDIDTTERYAYDGWKTGPQTQFVGNENSDAWADFDGNSSLATRYLRGDVIDQIFARTDAGTNEAYWLLTDRLGSLRNVVDDTQTVKDNIAYDGFGNVISESDAAYGGRYKRTGREVDVETGLQYNRARYYDGKVGRWISQDPLRFAAGDSNLYRYVQNEATIASDPSGLIPAYRVEHWVNTSKPIGGKFAATLEIWSLKVCTRVSASKVSVTYEMTWAQDRQLRQDFYQAARMISKAFTVVQKLHTNKAFRDKADLDSRLKDQHGNYATNTTGEFKGFYLRGGATSNRLFDAPGVAFYYDQIKTVHDKLTDKSNTISLYYRRAMPWYHAIWATDGGSGTPAYTPESGYGIGNTTILSLYFTHGTDARVGLLVHELARRFLDYPQSQNKSNSPQDVAIWDYLITMLQSM